MTATLPSIELRFQEGRSDKVYRAAIESAGNGYLVTFAYGRRGATLNTGTKTPQPVSMNEANAIYEKLVRSKTAKGYQPHGVPASGTGTGMTTVTDRDQRDTGLRAQLLNPIDPEAAECLYLDNDWWCMQEKFDGRRMLLQRKEPDTEIIAINRNGLTIGCPQAFADQLAAVNYPFLLDGEAVGEVFHAFDLLEHSTGDRQHMPYGERLKDLNTRFGDIGGCIVVAETAFGTATKQRFMQQRRTANKEGVVLKDLRASWSAGRPASGGSALKLKFWETCSCVVAKVNRKRSVELALGKRFVGNVTVPPNHSLPNPGQVVEIRYLYVAGLGGSLYQPVYLGVRDDVPASDCTIERQNLKYRAAA